MSVKKENRWFKCPNCRQRFHIRHNVTDKWIGYMPPAYCPKCGKKVLAE